MQHTHDICNSLPTSMYICKIITDYVSPVYGQVYSIIQLFFLAWRFNSVRNVRLFDFNVFLRLKYF